MGLLNTYGMSVTFGGLRAVDDIDFEVAQGTLVGLIGPNGAGKTTFIDGLTGFVPTSGRMVFDGHEIGSLPAHRRAGLGLGRTWQSLELFDELSVEENLQVAAERQSATTFLLDLVRTEGPGGWGTLEGAHVLTDTFGDFLRPYVSAHRREFRAGIDDTIEWLMRQVLLLLTVSPRRGLTTKEVRHQARTFLVPSVMVG